MSKKNVMASVAGAAGVIAVLTLVSRAAGFVRTVIESWVLGATPVADAYSASNNIPNILFEVIAGGALAGVVVPLISGFLVKKQQDEAAQTTSALLTWVLAVATPVALIVVVCAPLIASAILPTAHQTTIDLAAFLLRVFAVQVPLYGLSVILSGVLQAHRKFVLPAVAPLLSSLVVIATFGLYWFAGGNQSTDPGTIPQGAILYLAWGTTAGVAAFTLPQLIPIMKMMKLRPTFRFPAGVARRALAMAGAGFGGLLVQQAAILAIMVGANAAGGDGAFPIFKYAQAIYFLPYAILAVPIATALYPRISERAASDQPGLGQLVAGSLKAIIAASALGAALLAAVAPQATIIFSYVHDMPELTETLSVLAFGVIGYSLLYHCTRVLFATSHATKALWISVLGWGSVIIGVVITVLTASSRLATLTMLAGSLATGMSIAGLVGILACRSAIGHSATTGVWRTLIISLLGAGLAGLAGRFIGEGVLAYVGHGLGAAIGAALVAVIVATGIVGAIIYVCDRSTWRVGSWIRPEKRIHD